MRLGAPPNMKIWLLRIVQMIYHSSDDQLALSLDSHSVDPLTTPSPNSPHFAAMVVVCLREHIIFRAGTKCL